MSKLILSKKQIQLLIGKYTIQIFNKTIGLSHYFLPDNMEQFLIDCKKEDSLFAAKNNMEYNIQLTTPFVEPEDKPIAGFDQGPYPYSIYRINSGGYLWIRKNQDMQPKLVYQISEDWNTWSLLLDNSPNSGSDSFSELAYIFAYSVLNKGGIMFHGVVMQWEGMGIIICGHSGIGKTTHTRMWKDSENAKILNGDRALCYKKESIWYTSGAPWSGSSGEYSSKCAELKAVVILEQAEVNEIEVLPPLKGALELIQLAFAPAWDDKLINCSFDAIDDIAQNIQVLKLRCQPNLDAVSVLKAGLEELLAAI
ncbi:MAG: hypothetical protein K0R21_18 [Anaerocolumna sp.]|jgi:hypothetical protein|nr:hypothetical protein [Anaerocolumna sp.]